MPGEIKNAIDQAREYLASREDATGPNETETRHGIIDPILSALGWEPIDIRHEYQIEMGAVSKKVDSALSTEDHPELFLEAKAAVGEITDRDVSQLKSYMVQEWVQFGLLTTGTDYQLYYLVPAGEEKPRITLLAEETLDMLADSALPEILDREHMASGRSVERAEDLLHLDTIRTWLVNRPERVESALREVGTPHPDPDRFLGHLFGRRETSSFRYSVELSVKGAPVRLGGDNQSETMAKVAKYLDREHDLLEKVELPYYGRARKVPLLHEGLADQWKRSDDHPSEYRSHEQLRGNVYLYTGLSSKDKRTKIRELCDVCELDEPEFNEAWDTS